MKKISLCFLISVALYSCQTGTKGKDQPAPTQTVGGSEKSDSSGLPAKKAEPEIDYQSIKRLLRLDRERSKLGLAEKPFNTCQVGFGYPSDQNCQTHYLISIQFQLVCRETEGTVSEVVRSEDLSPVRGESLTWYLKGLQGEVRTDSEGYAEVLTASSSPQRNQRFRLSNQKDFLLMKTQDVNRLMVPKNWCR